MDRRAATKARPLARTPIRDTPKPHVSCVSIWHIYVTYGSTRSDGPERRPLKGARFKKNN